MAKKSRSIEMITHQITPTNSDFPSKIIMFTIISVKIGEPTCQGFKRTTSLQMQRLVSQTLSTCCSLTQSCSSLSLCTVMQRTTCSIQLYSSKMYPISTTYALMLPRTTTFSGFTKLTLSVVVPLKSFLDGSRMFLVMSLPSTSKSPRRLSIVITTKQKE